MPSSMLPRSWALWSRDCIVTLDDFLHCLEMMCRLQHSQNSRKLNISLFFHFGSHHLTCRLSAGSGMCHVELPFPRTFTWHDRLCLLMHWIFPDVFLGQSEGIPQDGQLRGRHVPTSAQQPPNSGNGITSKPRRLNRPQVLLMLLLQHHY
jgi:hypothetical protein